ncbi:uncharacterized protein IL334_001166 [Kwoniella shivajii]|uniref:DUF4048 domain-containing protein n=1 Tax=Kwoniella shivajii TaxID=564305 RepID=A0ABZ1CR69_9TREE|nr:hypothetical protein IL334_001166 [Kwoniella shivajii]
MMYTPTPATRRPRPPRSTSRQSRPPLVTSSSAPNTEKISFRTQAQTQDQTTLSNDRKEETPLSTYIKRRQDESRYNLSRISASPSDVSFALDVNPPSSSNARTTNILTADRKEEGDIIGLGIGISPSAATSASLILPTIEKSANMFKENSPPPPYGQNIISLQQDVAIPKRPQTPPRQDSGLSSRKASTSPAYDNVSFNSRKRSITEGGEATLFEVERGLPAGQNDETGFSEDDIDERDIKERFREMKQQLRLREEELLIAARVAEQALQSHEQVLSLLPIQHKLRLPPSHRPEDSPVIDDYMSHITGQIRHVSSSAITDPLSPVESYPSTVSTQHERFQSNTSSNFQDYALESPFRIPSPEHAFPRSIRNRRDHGPVIHHASRHHKNRPSIFRPQSTSSISQIPTPRYNRLAAIQAEAEERIISLEQALSDAQEGEETQRKVAARWRKEVDKMQRELDKVDERRMNDEKGILRESVIGKPGFRRKTSQEQSNQRHQESGSAENTSASELGWGYTTFPEFPSTEFSNIPDLAASSKGHTLVAAPQVRVASRADGTVLGTSVDLYLNQTRDHIGAIDDSTITEQPSLHAISVDDTDSMNITIPENHGETSTSVFEDKDISLPRQPAPRLSTSKFSRLSPKKESLRQANEKSPNPPTPKVTIESPPISPSEAQSRRGSGDSNSSMRRSPWPISRQIIVDPSPEVRRTIDFFSHSREGSRSPSMSPAFASLSSRMASMRAQINQSLSLGPSADIGRTLGSELGSEFGDDWDRDLRSLEQIQWSQPKVSSPSPLSRTSKISPLAFPNDSSESENELDHGNDDDTSSPSPVYQPSFPLPATVSAALSSLAMALAPSTIFSDDLDQSSRILPKGSLRESGLDHSAYDLLNVACKSKEIRWADDDIQQGPNLKLTSSCESKSDKFKEKIGSILVPLNHGLKDWVEEKDPWDDGGYTDESNYSENSNTNGKSYVIAKRAISFARSPKATPRRYALAHRRLNSSNYISHHIPSNTVVNNKAKGKITDRYVETKMRPDQTLTQRGIRSLRPSLEKVNSVVEPEVDMASNEPSTIPAKIVHDIFCIVSIWLEYMEWIIVLTIRVCMDIRSGPRGSAGLRKGERTRRYYI